MLADKVSGYLEIGPGGGHLNVIKQKQQDNGETYERLHNLCS
jgi:hypothetical protein